jgi:phenylalanyl-tRNA synthetase beta chain
MAQQASIALANPLSAEQARMRTTLLGSLLNIARHNHLHGAGALRVFEAGAVYLPVDGEVLPDEPFHIGALLSGPARQATWRDSAPPRADFYAAKGVLGGLLDALRIAWRLAPSEQPFLHPGRAADVFCAERRVGWLGEIHPQVAGAWELPDTVAAFELDLDALPEPASASYKDLTSFPELREDLAVVVAEATSVAEALSVVERSGSPLLVRVEIFDVYRDAERLGEERKSLGLRLAFRAADRTLTDEEVAEQRQAIITALAEELGGSLRDS